MAVARSIWSAARSIESRIDGKAAAIARAPAWTAAPNAGHRALAALEAQGKLHALITQNIDGLHQRAGVSADKVIEVHGTLHTVMCLGCGWRGSLLMACWGEHRLKTCLMPCSGGSASGSRRKPFPSDQFFRKLFHVEHRCAKGRA